MTKVKVAVMASGRGSNFQAMIDAINERRCEAEIKVLITDKSDAKAIERAKKNSIAVEIIERKKFENREVMDDAIKEALDKYGVELVVLAGYMRILKGKKLLEAYKNKIINIHPALLPAFKGATAQKDAFEYGVKLSGITIHFVDESLDGGPIIYQEAVDISDCEDIEDVSRKILRVEHVAYAKIVDSFAKGRYIVDGRKVEYVVE